jgi:hypothetical protein
MNFLTTPAMASYGPLSSSCQILPEAEVVVLANIKANASIPWVRRLPLVIVFLGSPIGKPLARSNRLRKQPPTLL